MRAIGPSLAGPLFAWSLNKGHKYPFNYWFVFLLQFLFLLFLLGLTFFLSHRLNYPRNEQHLVRSDDEEEEFLLQQHKTANQS